MKYRVCIEQDEDGIFIATCPALPGCVSEGSTRAEGTVNVKEAMDGYLRSLNRHNEQVPPGIAQEIVDVLA